MKGKALLTQGLRVWDSRSICSPREGQAQLADNVVVVSGIWMGR